MGVTIEHNSLTGRYDPRRAVCRIYVAIPLKYNERSQPKSILHLCIPTSNTVEIGFASRSLVKVRLRLLEVRL